MYEILEGLNNLMIQNIYIAPVIAFITGVLVAFSPCSLSSLPLLILYVSKNDKKKALKNSIIYAIGNTVTFVLLGIIVSQLGKKINLMNKYVFLIFGVLLIVTACYMMGIIKLPNISFINNRNNNKNKTKKSYLYLLFIGMLSGIFNSSCSTPVLIGILTLATALSKFSISILLLFFYGIGNAIVQVIFGSFISLSDKLVSSNKYQKIGKIINVILTISILILGLYMLYLGF